MSTREALRNGETATRLAGLALILAFVLSLTGGALHPVVDHDSHSVASMTKGAFQVAHLLILLGGTCLLVGLPTVYARIAPRAPVLGLVGFILYFLANAAFAIPFAFYEAFVIPPLVDNPATQALVTSDGVIQESTAFALFLGIGGTALLAGMLVFGIAIVRARVFPVWTGVLMALAPILLLIPIQENQVLTGLIIEGPRGLAVAAMGWMLLTGERTGQRIAMRPVEATA